MAYSSLGRATVTGNVWWWITRRRVRLATLSRSRPHWLHEALSAHRVLRRTGVVPPTRPVCGRAQAWHRTRPRLAPGPLLWSLKQSPARCRDQRTPAARQRCPLLGRWIPPNRRPFPTTTTKSGPVPAPPRCARQRPPAAPAPATDLARARSGSRGHHGDVRCRPATRRRAGAHRGSRVGPACPARMYRTMPGRRGGSDTRTGERYVGDSAGRGGGLDLVFLLEALQPVPEPYAAAEHDRDHRDVHVVD